MTNKTDDSIDRRQWMAHSMAGASIIATGGAAPSRSIIDEPVSDETRAPAENFRATKGRVKHSVMAWCFKPMEMETLIPACAKMGMVAMEGIDAKFYPLMKQQGLGVSLCSSHGFKRGPINRNNHKFCLEKIRTGIDLAVQWNCPGVITFTGMREPEISDADAFKNCVECWKSACEYADEKNINVVLEMLNSRDDTHPMKGHPGYFGDDIDRCIEMIKAVGSARMKLLFDVYHVQIMNGDVIRRFGEHKQYISHIHTAGNPGRCELDGAQEINYPAVMRAIVESGFDGYVAHEFIPTWGDKLAALRHGVKTCDV